MPAKSTSPKYKSEAKPKAAVKPATLIGKLKPRKSPQLVEPSAAHPIG